MRSLIRRSVIVTFILGSSLWGRFGTCSEIPSAVDEPGLGARVPVAQARHADLESLLGLANAATDTGDFATAERVFEAVSREGDRWYAWAGVSGLVATYRRAGDFAAARAATARVARDRPELAGLMNVWDGDTAMLEGDVLGALAAYRRAHGDADVWVGGEPVGALALRQTARAHLAASEPAEAAAAERELLRLYPSAPGREFTLARALAYEAMAAGDLPVKPLGELLHDGDCSAAAPCLIAGGRAWQKVSGGRALAGLHAIRFQLSRDDEELLREVAAPKRLRPVVAAACTVTEASDGFQVPMANDHSGYVFMSDIGGGQYHPGLDINGPGAGDADCGLTFRSVARGCVTDSSPANWGSATIQHSYNTRTWTSQYGHAATISYSSGSAITKGASLGTVGKVGTGSCHLHHELREPDHPAPTNADYYSSLSQGNVGDWYQNPSPFETTHRSYLWYRWVDEQSFALTGTWNLVTGLGDEDDMRWGATTTTGSKTTYARYTFTAPSSGTYQFYVFVPWNNAWSTGARYSVVRVGGSAVLNATVNQSPLLDNWVSLGATVLTSGINYYLEVATNTGESSARVGLDDILILKISNAI